MKNTYISIKNFIYKISESCKSFLAAFCGKFYALFDRLGKSIANTPISANIITLFGLMIGLLAMNFVAMRMYHYALVFILLNRFFDGLDGAVARYSKTTDFGLFLDTTCDYIFYASVIFGFALANPSQNAVAAAFLLFAFTCAAVTMLSYVLIAYRKQKQSFISINKSPFYLWGFAQGFEAFIAVVTLCILPSMFVVLAIAFGILSIIKAVGIIINAYYTFEISERAKK